MQPRKVTVYFPGYERTIKALKPDDIFEVDITDVALIIRHESGGVLKVYHFRLSNICGHSLA